MPPRQPTLRPDQVALSDTAAKRLGTGLLVRSRS